MPVELTIDRLGAQGDGVAETPDGPLFVPFTLPGERVRVEPGPDGKHGRLLEVVTASPDRIAPLCRHFGNCGGCALQHLNSDAYGSWKRDIVAQALRSRGLAAEVEALRAVPLGSRRRATFHLERHGENAVLGYRRSGSNELVEIGVCPILSPRIVETLRNLKAVLAPLLGSAAQARVSIADTDSGLDVLVDGPRPTPAALAKLAGRAGELGIARIAVGEETVTLSPPTVRFGRASVRIPTGAFLQASPAAEDEMTALVRDGVGKAKRIADLFSGLGTFSLALAEDSAVDAYEADRAACAALAEAVRHTPKLKPLRAHTRDLFRNPLGWQELGAYDSVVFDPPRAGAAGQARQLAKSKVKRLVAVSCNPGTLARDLRILADSGYKIVRVVPVDQFLFSSHVEVVAHLTR